MIDTTTATLEVLDRQIKALEEKTRALEDRRRVLYKQQQEQRENEAGDPQPGDLVIFRENYGDAKRGEVGYVEKVYEAHDERADGWYVTVTMAGGTMGGAALSVLMKVNIDGIGTRWKQWHVDSLHMSMAISEATGIWPRLKD